jgi:hypothetical protein
MHHKVAEEKMFKTELLFSLNHHLATDSKSRPTSLSQIEEMILQIYLASTVKKKVSNSFLFIAKQTGKIINMSPLIQVSPSQEFVLR